MAFKLVAVDGATLLISNPLVVATVSIIPNQQSLNTFGDDNGFLKDGFQISVSNITVPSVGATIPDPGPYVVSFSSTAQYVTNDEVLVLRQDDECDTINANPQIPGSPPVVSPISFNYKISVAGQINIFVE